MSNIEDMDRQQSPESQRQDEQGLVLSALDAISHHATSCIKTMDNQNTTNIVQARPLSQEHENGRSI